MNVLVLPEALIDLDEASAFYEAKEIGLGQIYRESVHDDLARLGKLGVKFLLHGAFCRVHCLTSNCASNLALLDREAEGSKFCGFN